MVGARKVVAIRLGAAVVDGLEMRAVVESGGEANAMKALFIIIK